MTISIQLFLGMTFSAVLKGPMSFFLLAFLNMAPQAAEFTFPVVIGIVSGTYFLDLSACGSYQVVASRVRALARRF
jgi:hypothetical protein